VAKTIVIHVKFLRDVACRLL